MFRFLLAASLAAALPQNFTPTTTSLDVSLSIGDAPEAGASLEACAPRTPGAGPATSPDSADAFVVNPEYAQLAVGASTPEGYTEVFENLQGSNIQLDDYLQFTTLSSYSTADCQKACDETEECSAFNIYFERDPVVEPAAACPDPSSTASIKCALYSSSISPATVTNFGQFREEFEVVIAGSNGYVKNASPPTTPTPTPEDPEPTPNPEDPETTPTPSPEDPQPELPTPGTPEPETPHPELPSPYEPVPEAPTYGDAPTAPKAPSCRAVYKK